MIQERLVLYLSTMGKIIHIPADIASLGLATEATLSDLNSKHNTLGQKDSDGSMPVVLSDEQEDILVSSSENQITEMKMIIRCINELIDEQKKTNLYLQEINR